jgi:pimeloyl-ACP methyl ester carboxylesterase
MRTRAPRVVPLCELLLLAGLLACGRPADRAPRAGGSPDITDNAAHRSGFVTVNGARLHYLDWGGSGPTLVMIHGMGSSPHYFDQLAAALSGKFRIVAYARRGHGQSDAKGPFDARTLTDDMRGLMDSLGIGRASIVGMSMGGNEVTGMGRWYPDRVDKVVYLDAAYEWGDFKPAVDHWPLSIKVETSSFAAYRTTVKETLYPSGVPPGAEADIRASVADRPDGSVEEVLNDSLSAQITQAVQSERRDYRAVHAPALAIFASDFLPAVGYPDTIQAKVRAWNDSYYRPFKAAQMARVRTELRGVLVEEVPGTHMDFIWRSHELVVNAIATFLKQ